MELLELLKVLEHVQVDQNGYLKINLAGTGPTPGVLTQTLAEAPQAVPAPPPPPKVPQKTELELIRETIAGLLGLQEWTQQHESAVAFCRTIYPDSTRHHFQAAINEWPVEQRAFPINQWLPIALTRVSERIKAAEIAASAKQADPNANCQFCNAPPNGRHMPGCPQAAPVLENPGGAMPSRVANPAAEVPQARPAPGSAITPPPYTVCNDPMCPYQRMHRVIQDAYRGHVFVHYYEDFENMARAREKQLLDTMKRPVDAGLELPEPPQSRGFPGVPPATRPPQTLEGATSRTADEREVLQPRASSKVPLPAPPPETTPPKRGRGRPRKSPQE